MHLGSLLIAGLLGLAVTFSASAQTASFGQSEYPKYKHHRKLQADENYIFHRIDTPFSFLQITRILELTTFFENSELAADYAYVENLNDGRGLTAGRIGFCTGTGDLVAVVEEYCKREPGQKLCSYLPRLYEIRDVATSTQKPNPDVSGLEHFSEIWAKTSHDKKFQQQQDQALIEMYFNPALNYFKQQNLKWPISLSVFYDTFIQHGEEGPDGFKFIFDKTNADLSGHDFDEGEWLSQFLQNRIQILMNPSNPDTVDEWRKSVDRAYKLLRIMNKDHNQFLSRPVYLDHETTTD